MRFEHTVEMGCSASTAFALLADFARNPEWQGGMESCVWTSEPPTRVGSTYDQVAHFLGRPIVTSFEVTAFEEGHTIAIESTVSTFPIQVRRTVEALGADRCAVTALVEGQPPWYLRLPGMSGMVARSVRGDYAALKALLENGAA